MGLCIVSLVVQKEFFLHITSSSIIDLGTFRSLMLGSKLTLGAFMLKTVFTQNKNKNKS